MVDALFCFVLISLIGVNGLLEDGQPPMIMPKINAVSTNCARSTGMTAEEIETAIRDKDINKLSACFFKCYINHFGVIRQEGNKDIVNVPAMLIFVKMYMPDISLLELLTIATEVMVCAKQFEKSTLRDEQPDCLKTKSLITCLAKKDTLINAFWIATQS